MKKAILGLMLLVTSTVVPSAQTTPEYNPFGVKNDVPVDVVFGGGWRVLYKGFYREGMPSVSALFRGACDKIILASKKVGSPSFDVLAAVESDIYVPLITPRNATVSSNGAEWYKNEQSMGFAGQGDAIEQTSADTNKLHERDRLSWHTIRIIGQPNTRLNPGWRSGNNSNLEYSDQWERFILTTSSASNGSTTSDGSSCTPIG